MDEKENQHNRSVEKTAIRCVACKRRLFDYIAGEFLIEIKCSRCRKINTIQCISSWNPAKNRKMHVRSSIKKKDSI